MKKSISLVFLTVFAGSCASAPVVAPPIPTVIVGCTADLKLPVCGINRERPIFYEGDDANDLKQGYEQIKEKLMLAESCIEAQTYAIEAYRDTCAVKKDPINGK